MRLYCLRIRKNWFSKFLHSFEQPKSTNICPQIIHRVVSDFCKAFVCLSPSGRRADRSSCSVKAPKQNHGSLPEQTKCGLDAGPVSEPQLPIASPVENNVTPTKVRLHKVRPPRLLDTSVPTQSIVPSPFAFISPSHLQRST